MYPKRIEFYIRYEEGVGWTRELYDRMCWWCFCNKYSDTYNWRGYVDDDKNFDTFKGKYRDENMIFIFDSWGLGGYDNSSPNSNDSYFGGLDNNKQSCKTEIDIDELRRIISATRGIVPDGKDELLTLKKLEL
jgi:hypothetical protein